MNEEVLKTVREKGLLLEKDIFDLVNSLKDSNAAKEFLEKLEASSGQKIITKAVLSKNLEYVQSVFNKIPGEDKSSFENIIIRLGLSVEIMKEKLENADANAKIGEPSTKVSRNLFQLVCPDTTKSKKIEVIDFVDNFRARYVQLQKILMARPNLQGLMSINKISNNRQNLSIIGMVAEKRTTKNKNIIIRVEDLTGEINVLVNMNREEVFAKAEELQLDDVVGIRASGNRDMLFVQDILFPDAFVPEKVKFDEDICIGFLSDMHAGSKMHLKKGVEKFINWINSGDETAKKIRYLFFVGDNVDGVGIFPGQEDSLELKSMEQQYSLLASYLKRIPDSMTIFMCPGQHDATRVAEPQPVPDKKYAWPLYELNNVMLVPNPSLVRIFEKNKEFKVLMYHGASIHNFINEIPELRNSKAHKSPAKAVKHMLKRRHLAPTHSSVNYIPNAAKDELVISEVPDVLATGEVHRLDIENYNGVLIITGSCWQSQTPFEEKVGNVPDPCKVPVLNLKTRELKIFDFSGEEEMKK
jgi:DNA polymerase II small subunit